MEEYREDKQMLEGNIRIVQGECDKCSDRDSARCKRYDCEKWKNGWVVEKISYGGSVDTVRVGLSFNEIERTYSNVLKEIRDRTRPRICEKYRKV